MMDDDRRRALLGHQLERLVSSMPSASSAGRSLKSCA